MWRGPIFVIPSATLVIGLSDPRGKEAGALASIDRPAGVEITRKCLSFSVALAVNFLFAIERG
jgi:hypothetical protein